MCESKLTLGALQSFWVKAEAPGPPRPPALTPAVSGTLGSVQQPTTGAAPEPRPSRPSVPGPQRQRAGGHQQSGVSAASGGAQDGEQPLHHREDAGDGAAVCLSPVTNPNSLWAVFLLHQISDQYKLMVLLPRLMVFNGKNVSTTATHLRYVYTENLRTRVSISPSQTPQH